MDSSGNSQKSYQQDLYGEVTGGSGNLSQEFDFAGRQTDAVHTWDSASAFCVSMAVVRGCP